MSTLLAVDDGLISGEYDAADFLFFVAAILFAVVTCFRFAEKAAVEALKTLGWCVVAVALLIL